jgi:hypothetical protein
MTAGIRHQRYCRKAWFSLINAWLKNHLGDFYFPIERLKWLTKHNLSHLVGMRFC